VVFFVGVFFLWKWRKGFKKRKGKREERAAKDLAQELLASTDDVLLIRKKEREKEISPPQKGERSPLPPERETSTGKKKHWGTCRKNLQGRGENFWSGGKENRNGKREMERGDAEGGYILGKL